MSAATKRQLGISAETWPVAGVFRISRSSRTEIQTVLVELREAGVTGRGECSPTGHYGESVASVCAQIEAIRGELENGLERDQLSRCLSAGAARNAVDCALWDLAAKRSQQPVWQLAGLTTAPRALVTAFTLSIDTPEAMATAARRQRKRPLLKLKLAGDGRDIERVRAVREQTPDARIIVDANEAWDRDIYEQTVPELQQLHIAMIEQPFAKNADHALAGLPRPIAVCADESCHTRSDLNALRERYDMVNIKLDKTGGLSEALHLAEQATGLGFALMVGCMLGTSLAMAPAFLVAQKATFVDLDGPILLAADRQPGLTFEQSLIQPPPAALWG